MENETIENKVEEFPLDKESGMEYWGNIYGREIYRQKQTNDFFKKTREGYVLDKNLVRLNAKERYYK
ncbi:hypothetical protein ACFLZZ_02810 [Nanoarchaeota archaeon]